jgi:hypothetical protein
MIEGRHNDDDGRVDGEVLCCCACSKKVSLLVVHSFANTIKRVKSAVVRLLRLLCVLSYVVMCRVVNPAAIKSKKDILEKSRECQCTQSAN